MVLGVFMDTKQKLFVRRGTLVNGASIFAGTILLTSYKVGGLNWLHRWPMRSGMMTVSISRPP